MLTHLQALASVITPNTKVWFSLAGEQGLSTFQVPKSWTALINYYR